MKGKPKEKHSYFWLVGSGGPGNTRERTPEEELKRKILIRLKYKALNSGIPFDLSLDDLHIPKTCPVFGFKFKCGNQKGTRHGGNPKSMSIDRIVASKGYVKGNVAFISLKANVIKETSTLPEMEQRLKRLRGSVKELEQVVRFFRKINK